MSQYSGLKHGLWGQVSADLNSNHAWQISSNRLSLLTWQMGSIILLPLDYEIRECTKWLFQCLAKSKTVNRNTPNIPGLSSDTPALPFPCSSLTDTHGSPPIGHFPHLGTTTLHTLGDGIVFQDVNHFSAISFP